MANTALAQKCQLYLAMPVPYGGGDAVKALKAALDGPAVASVMFYAAHAGGFESGALSALIELAQLRGVAAVIAGDIGAAKDLGADGVHIRAETDLYLRARDTLGSQAIVGTGCGFSRHAAMVTGELGADYVAFGHEPPAPAEPDIEATAEMVDWWSELFEPPCVAWHYGGLSEAERLVRAGADFLAVDAYIWRHPEGPRHAVSELVAAIQAEPASR